jgi:imidazolonepropionase
MSERLLLTGNGRLLGAQTDGPAARAPLSPWAILVDDGRIGWVGDPADAPGADSVEDLGEALVTPGLVDAHTHPAWVGDRSDEAAARLAGQPYDDGGIRRTVATTRAASDAELLSAIAERFHAALSSGTTTIEAKSGYGLSAIEELRALRLIGQAGEQVGIRVMRTFLGAHAVPAEAADADAYLTDVIDRQLPAVMGEADFVDVFCDAGFFSVEQAEQLLVAARGAGLGLRLHAEQLARTGAAELGVRLGALSVDHLEQLDTAGIAALAASSTVATLLPVPALVLRDRLPPARALLDASATVALASDANAGTAGNWRMPLVIGLGATVLGMTVTEAIHAVTAGGAAALGLSAECGTIRAGLAADIVAWDAEHEGAFALRLGDVQPAATWIAGVRR